ncbi:MAG TPA: TAXI family TRAP transporter solute-binding subunit [Candidatus Wallbacteria bacterium]|nr:TAXI family TRAP transporter solute-binding subunit [Candidatus Wallbacteria bacterium]
MKKNCVFIFLLVSTLLLCFSSGAPNALATGNEDVVKKLLIISTGDPQGLYFYCGKRIEKILNLTGKNSNAICKSTNGALDNIKAVASANADFGFSQYDMLLRAVGGEPDGVNAKNLCLVTILFPEVFTIVGNKGIKNVSDFYGKSISTHLPGSGIRLNSAQILKAAGLAGHVKLIDLNMRDTEKAFAEGKIDGFFSVIGMPASTITNSISRVKDSSVIPISEELRQKTVEIIKGFVPYEIPILTYSNNDSISTIATFAVIFTQEGTSDEHVNDILKSIYSLPDFNAEGASGKVRYVSQKNAKKFLEGVKGIKIHKAAKKFFDVK